MSFSFLLGILFIIGLFSTGTGLIKRNKGLCYSGLSLTIILTILFVYAIYFLPDTM